MKTKSTAKRMLATFVALLCLMTAGAVKTVTTVTAREQLTKNSTVYVGEVVVDGTSTIKYLYSGDMTVSNVVVSYLHDFLNGMADKDYAVLLAGHEFDYTTTSEGFALCTDADKIAAMDGNWSSAQYVGALYFPGKSVASVANGNLYDLDEGFKAVIDAENAQSLEVINEPIEYGKYIVSHIGSTSSDVVTYGYEEGEVVRYVNTIIDYRCEATTVIYTKVELVSQSAFDPYTTPLTFEAVEAGTITVAWDEYSEPTLEKIQYKLNDGEWTDTEWNTPIDVTEGDIISFHGNNGSCYDESIWAGFHLECSNNCYVYGNVMSLIDKDGYATNTTLTKTYTLYHLFQKHDWTENSTILNHPTKDIVLPATTLTDNCYDGMFQDCQGITRAPALPATTLAEWCYCAMFMNCSNLQTAPALPATTLAESCYPDMFINCTSLTSAPDLPATTLAEGCYSSMFSGCSSLNYVKCLATDISADYCTANWLYNVAATGTFVKAAGMEDWTVGPDADENVNGIPAGWTVRNDGEYTVTIPTSGVSTFSTSENVTIPAGVTAYTCTTYDNGASTISATAISGGVIPAETGVLLRGTAGETYTLTASTDEAEAIDNNALVAVTVSTHIAPTDGDYTNFMLKSGQFVRIADAPATSKMPANKAYLQIPTASLPASGDSRGITLVWDETTGIKAIDNGQLTIDNDVSMYNLSGQRVGKDYKGIVIVRSTEGRLHGKYSKKVIRK